MLHIITGYCGFPLRKFHAHKQACNNSCDTIPAPHSPIQRKTVPGFRIELLTTARKDFHFLISAMRPFYTVVIIPAGSFISRLHFLFGGKQFHHTVKSLLSVQVDTFLFHRDKKKAGLATGFPG